MKLRIHTTCDGDGDAVQEVLPPFNFLVSVSDEMVEGMRVDYRKFQSEERI